MQQFATIAVNAFMELVRQPVFLLLMTGSAIFEIFLATPFILLLATSLTGQKQRAGVMLLAGLFGAVLSASASLAREIRGGRRWRCCPSRWVAPNFCWPNMSG